MTEAKEIAAKLTEAQRGRFIEGTILGCCAKGSTRRSLIARGLAVPVRHPDSQALDWTVLGLAVRAAIVEERKE